jgi:hypothetical protein
MFALAIIAWRATIVTMPNCCLFPPLGCASHEKHLKARLQGNGVAGRKTYQARWFGGHILEAQWEHNRSVFRYAKSNWSIAWRQTFFCIEPKQIRQNRSRSLTQDISHPLGIRAENFRMVQDQTKLRPD